MDVPTATFFVGELRRRRVLRVVGFYAISVWLLLQVTNIVFPALYLPPWALTVVVVGIAAGFPIVAVLAWVFDLTPQGMVRTGPAEPDLFGGAEDLMVADRPRMWVDIAIIGVLLAIIAYLLVRPESIALRTLDASVAVLPFADMSEGRDQQYFSDGVAEELLDALVRVPGLKVAARTSSFLYREPHAFDVREIGERLGVATLLEGSVRRDGNRVRITAQLVDTRTGYHVWSESYDRTVGDIFAVQNDIASAIARTMRLRAVSQTPATGDTDAYDLYLQGRGALRSALTREALDDAVGYFSDALARDAAFTLAEAGLCDALSQRAYSFRDPVSLERALDACHAARARDPGVVEVHVALGWVYLETGRLSHAIESFETARSLGPRDLHVQSDIARGLGFAAHRERRIADAEAHFQRAVALAPGFWRTHAALGTLYLRESRYEEAVDAYRVGAERVPGNADMHTNLGGALAALGRRDEAGDAFLRALALRPTAAAFANAGSNLLLARRYGEARAMYARAVAEERGQHEHYGNLANACRHIPGAEACARTNHARAIELAEERLRIDPTNARVWALLAQYRARSGDTAGALSDIEQAVQHAPGSSYVYRAAAIVHALAGMPERALEYVDRAVASGLPADSLHEHPDLSAALRAAQ